MFIKLGINNETPPNENFGEVVNNKKIYILHYDDLNKTKYIALLFKNSTMLHGMFK